MTSKARLESNVSAPMHMSLVQYSKFADWELFPEGRKSQNRVQSEGLHSRNADHIFHLLPGAGFWILHCLKLIERSSSQAIFYATSLPFLRDAVGLHLAEAIGPVRISRRRRGAFHDKNRAITLRCPPKVVDAMRWPSSQLSLLLS